MKQYIVDAFTREIFGGNPAAVCVMDHWLSETIMQKIAIENNLSETSFAVREGDGYRLRWFTPGGEVDLCGHATLATGYTILRFYQPGWTEVRFHTLSGELIVRRDGDWLAMDFPTYPLERIEVTDEMEQALGVRPTEAYRNADLIMVLPDEALVRNLNPDQNLMRQLDGLCIIVTAQGTEYDCVSRVFCPRLSIPEDPVTGRAHCSLTPLWSRKLGKADLHAYQASARGGELRCSLAGDRTMIRGNAVLFAESELYI